MLVRTEYSAQGKGVEKCFHELNVFLRQSKLDNSKYVISELSF